MKSFEDLEQAFEKGLDAWQDRIFIQEAKKIGLNAASQVKELTPVDTGTLRRAGMHGWIRAAVRCWCGW